MKVSLSAAASLAARPSVECPPRLCDSRVRAFVVALAFVALTAPPASANTSQGLGGDGSFECVVNHNGAPNIYPINVGLNSGSTSTVEYYWAISSGYAMPYVGGVYKASTPLTTSDRLKIAVEGGVVKFYKNAELVYTSDVAPSFPLKGYFASGFDGVGLTGASFAGAN